MTPKDPIIWINSATLMAKFNGTLPSDLAVVIHDGMPDGVFYGPTEAVKNQLVKTVETAAFEALAERMS